MFSFDTALALYASIWSSIDRVCCLHFCLINKQETNMEINRKVDDVTLPMINCGRLSTSFCLFVSMIVSVGTKHIQKFNKIVKMMVKQQIFQLQSFILEARYFKSLRISNYHYIWNSLPSTLPLPELLLKLLLILNSINFFKSYV